MKKITAMVACGIMAVLILGTFSGHIDGGIYPRENMPAGADTTNGGSDATPPDAKTGYELDRDIRMDLDDATATLNENENDMNTNTDAGDNIYGAFPLYPGEVNDRAPCRGTEGQLDPSGDSDDWYYFAVAAGQTIDVSISSFEVELIDPTGETVLGSGSSVSATAGSTGNYFIRAYTPEGASAGSYELDVSLSGQNDAGASGDAGDDIGSARSISPGVYEGYLDSTDWADWYSFTANTGEGIKIELAVEGVKSDFDVHLYNPDGELVHEAMYYGDDTLEYPADMSGTWKAEIDIWPGWDTSMWPDDYFLYGSGPYEFELQVGGSVSEPPAPIPQPDITPVAKTFIIENNPQGSTDEYNYLAAVPAANYLEDGQRYLSPIVYSDVDTPTHWSGTVDDTTQYLLDDWNTYLARHGMTAEEIIIGSDPLVVAAEIATTQWASADTAVLAVDGSSFEDETIIHIDRDATLNVQAQTTRADADSSQIKEIDGKRALPMFIGAKWGVMTVYARPESPAVGLITPRYEVGTEEDWPHPSDEDGDNTNIYFPISVPGLWFPYVDGGGDWTLEVTKYTGDRYKIPASTTDCSIEVTVTSDSSSPLEVFLIDPHGNIRRPSVPHWNDPQFENIQPIHHWNGGHWQHNFEGFRRWEPTYTSEHTVELHYPMTGTWTVIVAPHYPYGEEKTSDSIDYHITAQIREHNPDRVNAAISAVNGAVLASLNHAPLLYVTEDSVPTETSNALTSLGASSIIYVNLNSVSNAAVNNAVEYTTMEEIITVVKASRASENVITVTSLGSLDGSFAASAMAAASHGSPVLNFGEIPDAYDLLDTATAFREYAGGWYHGCRAQGYLHMMNHEFDWQELFQDVLQGDIPEPGFDQDKRWFGGVHDAVHAWIDDYGLDGQGKEAYLFVGDRENDIRLPITRIMTGNNSFAGQIPFNEPAMQAALVSRNVLYSALIYANPGRDVTTSQLMNFPGGDTWTTNDGVTHNVYSTHALKESFSSHGRFYEGHCTWEGFLTRYNTGASISYYSGHGTGGSGISAVYKNIGEYFPYVELRHEELMGFEWWDAWRGYMYDDARTKTARDGGWTWFNAKEPNLYDIVHFKYVDELFDNLHSEMDIWLSCTTGQHFGPDIYLEHGAVLWFGNAASGRCPEEDLLDDWWLHAMMVDGKSIGDAFSDYLWLHQRDYTTGDPTSMYGSSSLQIHNIQVILGDPTLVCYSPEWIEPTPIEP